jgi:hypothetical protein
VEPSPVDPVEAPPLEDEDREDTPVPEPFPTLAPELPEVPVAAEAEFPFPVVELLSSEVVPDVVPFDVVPFDVVPFDGEPVEPEPVDSEPFKVAVEVPLTEVVPAPCEPEPLAPCVPAVPISPVEPFTTPVEPEVAETLLAPVAEVAAVPDIELLEFF